MIPKHLLQKFSWALSGRLLGALLQAASIIFLARNSQTDEFGLVATILAVATLLHAIMDLGISSHIIKTRSENKDSEEILSCLIYANSISLCAGLIFLAAFITIGIKVNEVYLQLTPLAIWISLEKMADILLCVHQADGENKKISISIATRRLICLASLMALTTAKVQILVAYSTSMAIAAAISYLSSAITINKNLINQKKTSLSEILKKSRPYWIHSMSMQARNIDTAIVTACSGTTQGAYFSAANRIISPLSMIPNSMAMVLMPSISKRESSKEQYLKSAYIISAVSSLPLLLIFVTAPYITPLLLGDAYEDAAPVLQVVCLGLAISSLSTIFSAILQGAGRAKVVSTISLITTSLYLTLLIFISYFGAFAAACLLSLSFVFRFYLSQKSVISLTP